MEKIRVLIADDHALVREGLRKLLELDENIQIITEVGDGQGLSISPAGKSPMWS